jgi:aminoglycoside/choline kinase family phosphotransferase
MVAGIPHEALARAVREAFGGAAVIEAVHALTGDASSRRYVRLELRGTGAPRTAVAMLLGDANFPLGSDELGGEPVADDELPFVNVARWLRANDFPVPVIHHDAARTDGFLLLEDIGDTTLWEAVSTAPERAPELFGDAVDLLVRLQVAGARRPDPGCRAFRQIFGERLARWELEHFVEHGIETRHQRRLPPAERDDILAALAPLAVPFASDAPVFAHRDFMAWNLHVHDGRLRLIDFQDALLAPEAYDLGALLTDRTTIAVVSPPLATQLLERFRRARAAAGMPVAGDLAASFRRCALQRALKVIGRFWYLEQVQGKHGYLAYLPAVYRVARTLLDADPPLAGARRLVTAYVPELAA